MGDVLLNGINLVEADFTLVYPDANLWSNTYNVENTTVDPAVVPLADGSRMQIIRLEQQTHALNATI